VIIKIARKAVFVEVNGKTLLRCRGVPASSGTRMQVKPTLLGKVRPSRRLRSISLPLTYPVSKWVTDSFPGPKRGAGRRAMPGNARVGAYRLSSSWVVVIARPRGSHRSLGTASRAGPREGPLSPARATANGADTAHEARSWSVNRVRRPVCGPVLDT
jgi:hypothetical protein